MRIGLVCPYHMGYPGGVQSQALELTRALQEVGEEVVLIGPGAESHGGIGGGRVLSVRANRSRVPLTLDRAVTRLVRSALRDVDVIHLHEPLIPVVGPVALAAGKPMVATFHAQAPTWARTLYRLIPRRRFQGRVLTAVSPIAARGPDRLGKLRIIPNGMDVHSHETGVQRHDQHVVFIGRDDPRKGLAVLLESWPAVRGRFVDAELGIVGVTGTDRSGVHFHGRVSEERKRELLGTAAILVAPNLGGESFGLVVTEAMASGCAVVASDLAAFRWVTGGTALLFPPGDVRGLSARLIELLNQPEVVAAMGRRGRALAAKYDWSVVLPSYRAAYRDAVGMGPPPR